MKDQFIDFKITVQITTDEEISMTQAEKMIKSEIEGAFMQRWENIQSRTEQMAPPWYKLVDVQ